MSKRFPLDIDSATEALKKPMQGSDPVPDNNATSDVNRGSVMDAINDAVAKGKKQAEIAAEQVAKQKADTMMSVPAEQEVQNNVTPIEKTAGERGGKSSLANNIVQITTTIDDIISGENKYKNSKNQVTISEDIKDFLGIIVPPLGLEISQILNNLLLPYFQNPEFVQQLRKLSAQRQREIAKKLEGENKALNITLKNKK